MRLRFSTLVLPGLAFALPAYAYVDPGAGSLLLQLLLGGVAGLFVFARLLRKKILRLIRFGKENTDKTS